MKILVFTYTYGAPTLTFIFEELKGLAKKNEVCIAYVQRESPDRLLFSNEVQLNRSSSGFRRWLFYFMRNKNFGYYQKDGVFKKELNRLIVSFKPDVIHCHFGPDFLFLYDNLEFDIPVSVVFHGYDASQLLKIYPSYVKKLKKVSKDKSVQAVYVSKFLRDNIRSHGIKFLREAVVYLGIDTNKFLRESDLTPNCKVFLQVSSFREKKGHEYTVKAFAKYLRFFSGEKRPKMILAGEGPLLEPIKKLVRDLKIEDSVDFPGLVSNEKAKDLMEKSSFFVHHSVTAKNGDTEGLPTVLKEAMAMGMPILSTWHSGIPELVEDGVNGVLVPERDVERMVEGFFLISRMSNYLPLNREKVKKHFSVDSHVNRLNQALNRKV